MTMPSAAHDPLQEFEENIQYVRGLIAGGVALQEMQNFPAHPEDMYRAAWNQAVSAMDHWLHRAVIEQAVRLANDVGNQRPQSMKDLKMPFEMVERIVRGTPSRVVFREFLEQEFGWLSFHSVDKINIGMKVVTHLRPRQIWDAVGRAVGMQTEDAKKHHASIIKRRNDISHRADRDANGQRQPMTAAEASAAVDWIVDIVHVLHKLLN